MNIAQKRSVAVSRAGFTLTELLVVVVIIVALAWLLFPALEKAQATAKRTACLSNLRQIMVGVTCYAASQNGLLPNSGRLYPYMSAMDVWETALYPSVGNPRKFLLCPSDTWQPGYWGKWWDTYACCMTVGTHLPQVTNNIPAIFDAKINYSYYWHTKMYSSTANGSNPYPYRLSNVAYPSRLIATHCRGEWPVFANMAIYGQGSDGHNAGFLDGHAQWVKFAEMVDPCGGWQVANPAFKNADWTCGGIAGYDLP